MTHSKTLNAFVINPERERYGTPGKILDFGQSIANNGYISLQFPDGSVEKYNNGRRTGIPEFYVTLEEGSPSYIRATEVIPHLRETLKEFFRRVVDPESFPPTPETQSAYTSAMYVIDKNIFPEILCDESNDIRETEALDYETPRDPVADSLIRKLVI